MMLTIDRIAILSDLMISYKLGDQSKYLRLLDRCASWMDKQLYDFYYNLGKSSIFNKKGYFEK